MFHDAYPDDEDLVAVLESFAVAPAAYLGHGGESWVYALPEDLVLRVFHEKISTAFVDGQCALLRELAGADVPFELPQVLEVGERLGRRFVVERRLSGVPGLRRLGEVDDRGRRALIESHLEATARLGDLPLAPRPYFGELLGPAPIRASTWLEYLAVRADDGLRRSDGGVPRVDVDALVKEFDEIAEGRFVHLDAFLDNMLFTGTSVSAVLDFGGTAVVGDPRVDVVAAVVYLSAPAHTPSSTPADADVASSWLRAQGLGDLLAPVRRWLAAFWAFAVDEPRLLAWCRDVLSGG